MEHKFLCATRLTIGEIALLLKKVLFPRTSVRSYLDAELVAQLFMAADRPSLGASSPNMPTVDTAVVYRNGSLIEATNMSEGRGTPDLSK